MWRSSRRACCKLNAETRHSAFIGRYRCMVLEFAQVEGMLAEWFRVRVGFTGEARALGCEAERFARNGFRFDRPINGRRRLHALG
jgi:hypothetical protein